MRCLLLYTAAEIDRVRTEFEFVDVQPLILNQIERHDAGKGTLTRGLRDSRGSSAVSQLMRTSATASLMHLSRSGER